MGIFTGRISDGASSVCGDPGGRGGGGGAG